MNSKRIFVAGGSGTAGRAYVQALARHGHDVTATARGQAAAEAVLDLAARPIAIDLADADATARAVAGAEAVVIALLGRRDDAAADEDRMTRNVIDAAQRAGVGGVVYTSVHKADAATGVAHFEVKGRLERYLSQAAVPATVLRPCTFMDGLAAPWITDAMFEHGVLATPVAVDAPISYVATADMAQIAVRAVTDPDLAGMTIQLGGPRPVTYRELILVFSQLAGKAVRYEQIPLDAVEAQIGPDMTAMIRLFNEEGFAADADPIVERLGIRLTPVEEFLRQALASSATGPSA